MIKLSYRACASYHRKARLAFFLRSFSLKQNPPPVLIVSGPTGVGKSSISVELAARISENERGDFAPGSRAEIISADSAQVYKGLDIGTAKVTEEQRAVVRHHFLDIQSPFSASTPFSAGLFALQARDLVDEIRNRGNIPIIVGGTFFYIDMLINGSTGAPPVDPGMQARIINDMEGMLWEDAIMKLADVDPVYAATLGQNDWKRLVRGIEVNTVAGKPLSAFSFSPRDSSSKLNHRLVFVHAKR